MWRPTVSTQIDLNGRKYWILSEPHGDGWKASVVELIDANGEFTEPIGIEATAVTRGAADEAAEKAAPASPSSRRVNSA